VTVSPAILFRCDGSSEIGLGHVVRCLALADELRDNNDCHIAFAMRQGPICFDMIKNKGYEIYSSNNHVEAFDYKEWMDHVVNVTNPKAFIMDVRDDMPISLLQDLCDKGILIVTIDDPSDRRMLANIVFYPPIPQVKSMDWNGFNGELHVGWEWVILRPEFAQYRNTERQKTSVARPNILITMGGSDPAGLTFMAVDALRMIIEEFEATVVIGPGFKNKEALLKKISEVGKEINVVQNPGNMAQLMSDADLAMASFGVTAYELAAMGVPAIYLCLTEDHAESSSVFVEAGIAENLGIYTVVTQYELSEAMRRLLTDTNDRLKMSKRAIQLVDGRGTERIARMVVDRLRGKHG